MRLDKVWVVAKKDMSEFKNNKYIMYSLILMPLLMAVVLPIIYLSPATLFATNPTNQPIDLELSTNQTYQDQVLTNASYSGASFVHCSLDNVLIEGSIIDNCTVNGSIVRSSSLVGGWANNTWVVHSNLDNNSRINTILQDSVVLGQQNDNQTFLLLFINFLLIFFVMIPTVIPTVIASYSFVGEKLNRSLEPLLATPTTDAELLAGKSLSILLPSVLVTWLAFIPFVFIVDTLTSSVLGYIPLPNLTWILGVFLLAPLFCLLSIGMNVIVSAKVTDVRASQQIGSLVILPVVALFVVSLAGLFELGPLTMLMLSGVVLLVDLGVFFLSLKTFRREEILIKWK
jgi:ABC-2 type transport system permease protein